MSAPHKNTKSVWHLFAVMLVMTGVVCMIFDAFKWEPEACVVTRYDLHLKNWSSNHNGLRIAILSDIHQQNRPEDFARLHRAIQMINAEKPHMIFLLGDFLNDTQDWQRVNASPERIASELRDLKAPYGVYAVLGNHDWWIDGDGMKKALKDIGVHVLENDVETVLINGSALNVIGLPDFGTREDHFDASVLPDPTIPALTLAHDPDIFAKHKLPYEIMFSGHTHGGQVKMPVIGAVTASSPDMSRFTEGLFKLDDRQLLVTRGFGTSLLRIRFLCLPEIVVVTLRQEGTDSSADTDFSMPEK